MNSAAGRIAVTTIARKRGRLALLLAATALAAALITAVSSTLESVRGAIEAGVGRITGQMDARIIHPAERSFDASVIEQVRGWPEVLAAAPGAYGDMSVMVVEADGELRRAPDTTDILRRTLAAKSIDAALDGAFEPLTLREGAAPAELNEVVIDPLAADSLGVGVGDRLKVNYLGPPIELTITGIEDRPSMGFLQRPRIRPFVDVLQLATSRPNTIARVYIRTRPNVDVEAFCRERSDDLPEPLRLEPSTRITAQLGQRLKAIDYGLLITTLLTFMCAGFIIVTGLTTAVTEQQRELAIMRCLGATRRQVFTSQLLAGVLLAVGGAAIGAPLGIALASAIVWFLSDLLNTGLAISTLGVALTFVGAIGSGLLGGLYPAVLAAGVPPMQAMAREARQPRIGRGVMIAAGAAVLLIGAQLALFAVPDRDVRFWLWALAGLEFLHIGYLIGAIVVLAAVVRLMSPGLSRLFRLPRGMLARSMDAHLYRNGLVAGALMVGISILISTWANATAIFDGWLGRLRFADAVVFNGGGMTEAQVHAIQNLPFVTDSTPMNAMPMRVTNVQVFGLKAVPPPAITVIGFEPETFFALNEIAWSRGEPDAGIPLLLSGEGVLVADRFVIARGIDVGDRLTLATLSETAGRMNLETMLSAIGEGSAPSDSASNVGEEFVVAGAVSAGGFDLIVQMFGLGRAYADVSVSCVFMDRRVMTERFGVDPAVQLLQVNLTGDVDDQRMMDAVESAAGAARFVSARWIRDQFETMATAMYIGQSMIAFAALVLAAIGVGNIVLAGVTARRYEFGVLRAVGAGRGTVARLILAEVLLLAIAGAATGTMLAIHVAWVAMRNSRDLFGLPIGLGLEGAILPGIIGWFVLIVIVMIAALPGVRAAIVPPPSRLLAARNE